jgi:hypothetical protein
MRRFVFKEAISSGVEGPTFSKGAAMRREVKIKQSNQRIHYAFFVIKLRYRAFTGLFFVLKSSLWAVYEQELYQNSIRKINKLIHLTQNSKSCLV